ncbi:MAG: chromate transporter [Bacteroidales bacterium]|nr:chromate transporter [Bacteroidales bacterium]
MLLFKLFASFFKLGCFTFGGGNAMIPVIEHEVVEQKSWMTHDDFAEMIAVAQSLPGPISLNSALYTGYRKAGLAGGIATALGIILPSFIIILLIAIVFGEYQHQPVVEKAFKGIRPVVVAIIAGPLVRMAKLMHLSWKMAWLPVVTVALVCFCRLSPVWVLLAAAVGGIVWQFYREEKR